LRGPYAIFFAWLRGDDGYDVDFVGALILSVDGGLGDGHDVLLQAVMLCSARKRWFVVGVIRSAGCHHGEG